MMTEDEARKKWCPAARVVAEGRTQRSPPHNRAVVGDKVINLPRGCDCIASDCMWWRWDDPANLHEGFDDPEKRTGYCGIAAQAGVVR